MGALSKGLIQGRKTGQEGGIFPLESLKFVCGVPTCYPKVGLVKGFLGDIGTVQRKLGVCQEPEPQ